MLNEIAKHLEGSQDMYDFADAIVQVRLKMTREMYLEELDRLSRMADWSDAQAEDYEELTLDVHALNHVIRMYHIEE